MEYQATSHLAAALEQTLQWPGDVRMDMRALDFIDLAGLRVLVHTAERLGEGRRLRVTNLSRCCAKSSASWASIGIPRWSSPRRR
ncbi:STAS domain-containing protein [Streptomyces sp. 24-1644]|uniref:STAS domain-containing protein n=1 Tax=Streptomyces sp. 24-1644 TaxID=3457315 RepID=UPI003FA6EFBF